MGRREEERGGGVLLGGGAFESECGWGRRSSELKAGSGVALELGEMDNFLSLLYNTQLARGKIGTL